MFSVHVASALNITGSFHVLYSGEQSTCRAWTVAAIFILVLFKFTNFGLGKQLHIQIAAMILKKQ